MNPSRFIAGEEAIEIGQQRRKPGRDDPRHVALGSGGERDVVIEVNVACRGRGQRTDDRVADGAVGHLGEEPGRRGQIQAMEMHGRMGGGKRGDIRVEAGAFEIGDRLALEILPGRRLVAVEVVDELRFDRVIAGAPQHLHRRFAVGIAACRGRHGLAFWYRAARGFARPQQSAGADVRLAASDGCGHLCRRLGDHEAQRQFLFGGEPLREVGIKSDDRPVGTRKIDHRPRSNHHHQFVGLLRSKDRRWPGRGGEQRGHHGGHQRRHQRDGDEDDGNGDENLVRRTHFR